jgi:uncharacterized protein YcnI
LKKWLQIVATSVILFVFFTGIASAHVTVQPRETTQGKYEVFTVRVPSEHESEPTTSVEVKIPESVNITRVEPEAGWRYDLTKDASGKIISIVWTAEGKGILPTEFVQFNIQGRVADDATEIVWIAYQTYGDGSVVEWVGAPDSEHPASVTKVNAQPAKATNDGHGGTEAGETAYPEAGAPGNSSLYLAIAALIVSIVSLVFSLRGKRA